MVIYLSPLVAMLGLAIEYELFLLFVIFVADHRLPPTFDKLE